MVFLASTGAIGAGHDDLFNVFDVERDISYWYYCRHQEYYSQVPRICVGFILTSQFEGTIPIGYNDSHAIHYVRAHRFTTWLSLVRESRSMVPGH